MIRLGENTTTGLAAVLLATGVGAIGWYLRSDVTASVDRPVILAQTGTPTISPPDSAPRSGGASDNKSGKLVFSSVEPTQRINMTTGPSLLDPAIGLGLDTAAPKLSLSGSGISYSRPETAKSSTRVASLPSMTEIADSIDVPPQGYARIPSDFCNINVRASARPFGRVRLRVLARCNPGSDVAIRHAGLTFSEQLGHQGELAITIPAFARYSRFDIALADGQKSSTGIFVTGLENIKRVGISWAGENTIFLHVYEPDLGGMRHIWSFKPRSYQDSLLDGGGFMTMLGNPNSAQPNFAQIYTYPVRRFRKGRLIKLTVETLVNDGNCDKNFGLKTARHTLPNRFSGESFVLKLPGCKGGSDSITSKNLIKDIRVAGN